MESEFAITTFIAGRESCRDRQQFHEKKYDFDTKIGQCISVNTRREPEYLEKREMNDKKNCKFVCGIHLTISHRNAHPRSGKSLKSISFMNISYTFANDLAIRCRRSARRRTLLIEYRRRRRTRKNNLYFLAFR